MSEKMQGGELRINNPIVRWFENYWYYYKAPVIGIAFALSVIIICTVQMCQKDSPDVNILYAGAHNFAQVGTTEVEAAFTAVMPEDYNGDGRKEASVVNLMVYSAEQIKAAEAEAAEAGDPLAVNTMLFAQEKQKFSQLLMTGEYTIVLCADWLYDEMKGTGVFMPFTEAIGAKPAAARDDASIYLRDTGFGQYFTALGELPEETVICFRARGSLGTLLNEGKAEKTFMAGLDTFRAVMGFDAE